MISGLEVIGLALNIFPVLVLLVESYHGRITGREYRVLVLSLKNRQMIFLNCIEKLLASILPDRAELYRLLEDQSGESWKNETVTARLREHLGSTSDELFETANDIFKTANKLREKLPPLADSDPDNILQRGKRIIKLFVQGPRSRTNLQTLIHRVEEFRLLTEQGLELAPSRRTPRKPLRNLIDLKERARELYEALRHGWQCDCSHLHPTSLRLEVWQAHPDEHLEEPVRFRFLFLSSASVEGDSSPLDDSPHEQSIMTQAAELNPKQLNPSIPDEWTVVEIVPLNRDRRSSALSVIGAPPVIASSNAQSTTRPAAQGFSEKQRPSVKFVPAPAENTNDVEDNAERGDTITNLCTFLKGLEHGPQTLRRCLGHLTDSDGGIYKVFSVTDDAPTQSPIVYTHLGELYSSSSKGSGSRTKGKSTGSGRFTPAPSTANRLQLALKLGWNVLQLHSTHWLENYWNKDNILLVFDPSSDYQPYIEHHFQSTRRASVDSNSLTLTRSQNDQLTKWVRNTTLFTLGVILIELCYQRSIEELAIDDEKDLNQQPHSQTRFLTAFRLEPDVKNELGLDYANAVRACLYCQFGPELHDLNLGNEQFQLAVYENVIKPLEESTSPFVRRSIPATA